MAGVNFKTVEGFVRMLVAAAKQSIGNKLNLRREYRKNGIRNLQPYLINSSFIVIVLRQLRHKIKLLPRNRLYRIDYDSGLTLFSPYENHAIALALDYYTRDLEKFIPSESVRLVIVDAGAHIGSFSLPLAFKYRNSTTVAVEIDPRNCQSIRQSVEQNRLERCFLIEKALWSEGTSSVRVHPLGPTTSSILEAGFFAAAPSIRTYSVETVTLPDVFETAERLAQSASSNGNRDFWIFKMDIEGSEYEAMDGNLALLDRIDILVLELHQTASQKPRESTLYRHVLAHFDIIFDRNSSGSFSEKLVEVVAINKRKESGCRPFES